MKKLFLIFSIISLNVIEKYYQPSEIVVRNISGVVWTKLSLKCIYLSILIIIFILNIYIQYQGERSETNVLYQVATSDTVSI